MSIAFNIIIIASFILIFLPIAIYLYSDIYPQLKDSSSQDMAREKGVMTHAKVIAALQTSNWGGNKPVYKLTFRFKTAKGEVIEASLMKALTFKEIEEYKEGNQVTIKYIPDDPHKICLLENI